jgi:hypothetical protein
MLNPYISKIEALQPHSTGCVYKTNVWKNLSAEHKELIRDFEDKMVSRADVIKSYNDYYTGSGDYLRAFLLTMIWGFEDTGYGTFRTNSYITIPAHTERVRTALEAVGKNNIEKAFKELKRIKGLGISYLSKVLFFATKGKGLTDYCLVFDIRVARSLVMLTAPAFVNDIVNVYPSDKWEDYQKYNDMIHNYAKQYNVEAEALELFLFNQEF